MRERAEAATPGPWHSLGQWLAHDVEGCTCGAGVGAMPHEGGCGIEQIATLAAPDAKYVASMHPGVALTIATILEQAAARAEAKMKHGGKFEYVWSHERHALEIARAYLGEPTS